MTKRSKAGFTLAEVLMAVAILAIVILTITSIFNSASSIASTDNKRFDADGHARALLDRMAIDFAKLLKRNDLDYFLKSTAVPQPGNDQMAFYCALPGYYPSTGAPSPFSIVAYRINGVHQLERMGKGLVWNGVSTANAPLVFLPVKIADIWVSATNADPDIDYEVAGRQAFRFEYQYLLRSGTWESTPWDPAAGHTVVAGLQDVSAIGVVIASIDPRSRALLSEDQVSSISATLSDFRDGQAPGSLAAEWQTSLDGITDLPRAAVASVKIYQRFLPLTTP